MPLFLFEVYKMKDLNEDGLVPGQHVDYETLQRVTLKAKEVNQDAEQPKTKAKPRAAKSSAGAK